MKTILGISGSLRQASYNTALLRAAAEATPTGCTIEITSIKEIPLYDGDLESASGIPEAVSALKERIARSDGLLLATPEYNSSIPGVFKNAIDWLSRPTSDLPRVFGGLPVGLMGATPGRGGTRFAQNAWLPILRALGMRPWFGKQLYVGEAGRIFDESGRLSDDKIRDLLTVYMAGFTEFVSAAM